MNNSTAAFVVSIGIVTVPVAVGGLVLVVTKNAYVPLQNAHASAAPRTAFNRTLAPAPRTGCAWKFIAYNAKQDMAKIARWLSSRAKWLSVGYPLCIPDGTPYESPLGSQRVMSPSPRVTQNIARNHLTVILNTACNGCSTAIGSSVGATQTTKYTATSGKIIPATMTAVKNRVTASSVP